MKGIQPSGSVLGSAASGPHLHRRNNTAGRATVYEDVRTSSPIVQGVGIESQDIVAMTDRMMRTCSPISCSPGAPRSRVIVDSQYFTNESSSRINKNMITDRLRIELQRAAQGRMVFIGREYSGMVEAERGSSGPGLPTPAPFAAPARPLAPTSVWSVASPPPMRWTAALPPRPAISRFPSR